MNIIGEVLSGCLSSARADPIKLVQPGGRHFMIPGQINVMLLLPSGARKSTMMSEIDSRYIETVVEYSLPGLIGSISDTGDVIPGHVMKAAGKVLNPDEFHSLGPRSRKALLSITEQQKAKRILGRMAKRPVRRNSKFLKYEVKDNEINIKYIRMPILLSGIFAPHKQPMATVDDFALSSRFIHLSLQASLDDLDSMALGRQFYDIKVTPYVDTPEFTEWPKFINSYREVINNLPPNLNVFFRQNTAFYTRLRLLLARFFGYASRGDSTVRDWEKYLPCIRFLAYCTVASTLTHSEYEIYELLRSGKKQREIAAMRSCSEAAISSSVKKIRGVGLG